MLGAGTWATRAHVPGWLRDPRCEVVAICDVELDRARALADELGIGQAAADWLAVVARPDLYVIDVVTPSHTHHELACAALEAGKHVLCEKPVAYDFILEVLPSTVQLTPAALTFAAVAGVTLGIFAAVNHGTWIDTLTMGLAMLGVSMPVFYSSLLMILLFSFTLAWLPATGQGGVERLIMPTLALGMLSATVLAWLVRSSMLEVLRQEYLVTARAKGLAERLVLPNVAAPLIVLATLGMASAIITGSALSFLGLGIRPPTPDWGNMLADGREFLQRGWWIAFFPGLAIMLTVLSINLLGDGLRDALDPRMRQ